MKAALPLVAAALLAVAACADSRIPASPPTLAPGEVCEPGPPRLLFDPPTAVIGPGESRAIRLILEPDACAPVRADLTSADPSIAASPPPADFDLRKAAHDFVVTGSTPGRTVIEASVTVTQATGATDTARVALPVHVRSAAAPTCSPADDVEGTLGAGSSTLRGRGALSESYLSSTEASFARRDELGLPSFGARIGCASDDLTTVIPDARLKKLGPAVTFEGEVGGLVSSARVLRREVEVALPVNPAAMPSGARMRHLVILYQGVRAKRPRPIAVANPRVIERGDDYALVFQTPWLGTYQASVAEDAGSRRVKKRLAHRAVMGISMGGGGAASFGMRRHDMFDALAPLGGPSDWTWLLWYIETNALGGFCRFGQTCEEVAPNLYPMAEPFAHTMDYDHWFYEYGEGNGGRFQRSEYIQIFEDLSLAMGNPNGASTDPTLLHMALGPKRGDPWVEADPTLGLPPGVDCTFTVDPIRPESDADLATQERQRELERRCRAFRCDPKNVWKAETGYYDDEYNPFGTLPVISFCDGNEVPGAASPYANTWAPGGDKPMNLALAVDLNRNGLRDEGEPVIRSGHEPFDDCGADGLCNPDEPGYDPIANPDPNQDDYDFQINPAGLEGNHRWDPGEPYRDDGLDGVPGTAALHVAGDPGEGDGRYTESAGLANFYRNDAHSILERRVKEVPAGELTDAALRRIDVLADGGVRDLFNFASVANHLTGQIAARRDERGLFLRSVSYYNDFHHLPGQTGDPKTFEASAIRWADVADMPNVRYGDIDASRELVERDGDGQHVGSPTQIVQRVQTAFYFMGRRWPDADHTRTEESREAPAPGARACEIDGKCQEFFTGPRTGRTGPISVSLPPGYAHEANVARDVRYPVLYFLHGYGQDPRDLEALALFTSTFMNAADRSSATRLGKFILVNVDGRCRVGANGKPECIRGTFYLDSARPDGALLEGWFAEVIEHVDKTYRTMPPSEVEVDD